MGQLCVKSSQHPHPPHVACAEITLGSQLRRKPNAFNLLHQLQRIERSHGAAAADVATFNKPGALVKEFGVGPAEAKAVHMLRNRTSKTLVERFTTAIKQFGFSVNGKHGFLTHDALGCDALVLNLAACAFCHGHGCACMGWQWVRSQATSLHSLLQCANAGSLCGVLCSVPWW